MIIAAGDPDFFPQVRTLVEVATTSSGLRDYCFQAQVTRPDVNQYIRIHYLILGRYLWFFHDMNVMQIW